MHSHTDSAWGGWGGGDTIGGGGVGEPRTGIIYTYALVSQGLGYPPTARPRQPGCPRAAVWPSGPIPLVDDQQRPPVKLKIMMMLQPPLHFAGVYGVEDR